MSYLSPTSDQISKVKKFYKVTDSDLKRDVNIIQKWIQQEKHLPQNVTDDWFIESFLIRNKLLIERVKSKIDAYYSIKTRYRSYFENYKDVVPSQCYLCFFFGALTPDLDRIYYCKVTNPNNLELFEHKEQIKYYVMTHELQLKYDYNVSSIMIVDFDLVSFEIMRKVNPVNLRDYLQMFEGAYAGRFKAIHFVNIPSFVSIVLGMIKPLMSSKMFKRIYLHSNVESLYKVVPKDYLISDLGGKDKSMKEYTELMDQTFEDHKPFFKQLSTNCSNEELRIGKVKDYGELVFGTNGSFKQINLD